MVNNDDTKMKIFTCLFDLVDKVKEMDDQEFYEFISLSVPISCSVLMDRWEPFNRKTEPKKVMKMELKVEVK
jgi:hypothetical protein